MKQIKDLFLRIKKLTTDIEEKQNQISKTISEVCGIQDQKFEVKIKQGKLFIKGLSSGQKNNVYLKQSKIISELQKKGLDVKDLKFFVS
jgi:HSP20 family molecular chaperone IbpA